MNEDRQITRPLSAALRRRPAFGSTRWISTPELAEWLGVHPGTASNWRREGTGPPFTRVGGVVRYRVTAVEAWLLAREVTSTSDADELDAARASGRT